MESVNLASSLRPRTFDEVVGNQATVESMKKALAKGKVSSTYMFSGPTGVGKTTLAFLFSRYLNCETHSACGECASCKHDIDNHPDVIYMNIGAKGGVDDMRNLLRFIGLAPRYNKRIVLLDEVHMLTKQAANSLLVDLEKPPADTVFLLCTTEPQKLVNTVGGRCAHYKLGTVEVEDIVDRLVQICKKEGFKPKSKEDKKNCLEALTKIAEASNGHVRNSINLLQQYLSLIEDGTEFDPESVESMIAASDDTQLVVDIALALASMDLIAFIAAIRSVKDIRGVMHKLRWLIFGIIGNSAKSNKWQTAELKLFLAAVKKKKTKYGLPMMIESQAALVEAEALMNAGIPESIAIETKLAKLMVDTYKEKKKND